MMFAYIFLGLIVLLGAYLWSLYNGLITKKLHIDESWSQIDVQLKRRNDLIPNLVETVKGYAKHEKTVFSDVSKARSAMMGAVNPKEMAKANDALSSALSRLMAIAENYPKLEASSGFVQLQKELSDTEDKVAYARQYYNSTVMEYNVAISAFPGTVFATQLGFTKKEFFEATPVERKSVKVDFS